MTEPSTSRPPWYRDGCLWAILILFLLLWLSLSASSRRVVDVRLSGRIQQGLFTDPRFDLLCWHQHPGDLKQGTLTIWIRGKNLSGGEETRLHSFEIWSPNQDQAVNFSFSLENYDPNQPLQVTCFVKASNARETSVSFVWRNDRWQE